MRKDCKNCRHGINKQGGYRPYWMFCRKLYCRVRANANRCKCKHWMVK